MWLAMGIALGCSSPSRTTTNTTIVQTNATATGELIRLDSSREQKMYESKDGYHLVVVPVIAEGVEFLVTETSYAPHSKSVWPTVYVKNGKQEYYRTQRHGGNYAPLIIAGQSSRYENDGYNAGHEFVFFKDSPKLVSAREANEILELYIAQRASGHTESVQRWDRVRAEAHVRDEAKKHTELLHQNCKTQLRYTIDTKNMSDEVLRSHPGFDEFALVLRKLCSAFPDVAAQLTKAKVLSWKPDGKRGLSKDGDQLRWTPVNDGDEIESTMRATLDMERRVAKTANGTYFYVDAKNTSAYVGDRGAMLKHRVIYRGNLEYLYLGFNLNLRLFTDVGMSKMYSKGSAWTLTCGRVEHALTELTRSERDTYLSSVSLSTEYQFNRTPFALARDERGVYYYVDRLMSEKGGKDYRVYIGRKGAVKKTLLKDVVDDSEGLIFETAGGDLRLRIDRKNSQVRHVFWSKKKKRTELTILDPQANGELIFRELGVYEGVALGTICSSL